MYGINAANGLKMLGNNAAMYCKLLNSYANNPYYTDFVDAVASGDMTVSAAKAHALKGVSANLCLDEVYELMKVLEAACKESSLTPADPRMAELAVVYEKTITSIRAAVSDPTLLTQ